MEVLMRNFLWHANMVENKLEGSVAGDLRVNYNNIHKVVYLVMNDPCVLVFTEYCLLRVNYLHIMVTGLMGTFHRAVEF